MPITTHPSDADMRAATTTPKLQNGDHLTRAEFERRYEADPRLKKAELIDGVVFMPSSVRYSRHGKPHFMTIGWLSYFTAATPGVEGGDNASLRLDLASEPQPDAFLLILPKAGGQARIDAEDYVLGAPELIAEITASSISYDLHEKLRVYQRNGVKEYVVWRVEDRVIDWYVLRQDHFEPLPATEVYQSTVFGGLCLDHQALIRGDLARVLQVLNVGLASPEHAAFVQRLEENMNNPT
jgi:Uma2 family endonuclease